MSNSSTWRFISQIQAPDDDHGAAYWFLFQNDKLAVRPVHGPAQNTVQDTEQGAAGSVKIPLLRDPAELGITPVRRQFLGFVEEAGQRVACYSAELDAKVELDAAWIVDNLRGLYPALGDAWFQLAGRAVQIVDWDRTHLFCGRCGAPMAADGRVVGVLFFDYSSTSQAQVDLTLAKTVADQCALLVESERARVTGI